MGVWVVSRVVGRVARRVARLVGWVARLVGWSLYWVVVVGWVLDTGGGGWVGP